MRLLELDQEHHGSLMGSRAGMGPRCCLCTDTHHGTTIAWQSGPRSRWVITREILIYEQQNLGMPSPSGDGDKFPRAFPAGTGVL